MIHRYTTNITELIVPVNLGQLQDNCNLFPQPRKIQVQQNGSFEIVGFMNLSTLMGLPIISRHVLVPRGRSLEEPHLLQAIHQAQKNAIALAKYEDKNKDVTQYCFICPMNYKTEQSSSSN